MPSASHRGAGRTLSTINCSTWRRREPTEGAPMTEARDRKPEQNRDLDRIVFFSDAVFAIAITLLVLQIEVPDIPEELVVEELGASLLALWPKYLGYVISFLSIAVFWNIHH